MGSGQFEMAFGETDRCGYTPACDGECRNAGGEEPEQAPAAFVHFLAGFDGVAESGRQRHGPSLPVRRGGDRSGERIPDVNGQRRYSRCAGQIKRCMESEAQPGGAGVQDGREQGGCAEEGNLKVAGQKQKGSSDEKSSGPTRGDTTVAGIRSGSK